MNIGLKVIKDSPSLKKRMEKIDNNRLTRLKEARDTKNFKYMIENWADEKLTKKVLSEEQRMAIYLMTDFVHNFSYEYIAVRLNVSKETISKWRNDPFFIQQLDKELTRRRSFIRLHAFRNVHRAILRGDMKATWNYLKMSGDLKENINIVDRTGEHELSEHELEAEIARLSNNLANANTPSQS